MLSQRSLVFDDNGPVSITVLTDRRCLDGYNNYRSQLSCYYFGCRLRNSSQYSRLLESDLSLLESTTVVDLYT